jgi:hypothetical protein
MLERGLQFTRRHQASPDDRPITPFFASFRLRHSRMKAAQSRLILPRTSNA